MKDGYRLFATFCGFMLAIGGLLVYSFSHWRIPVETQTQLADPYESFLSSKYFVFDVCYLCHRLLSTVIYFIDLFIYSPSLQQKNFQYKKERRKKYFSAFYSMDEFLKLDWTPKAEDILSDRYVNDERLRNESVTYKILLGSFNNPFSDVRIQNEANNKNKKRSSSLNPKASFKTEPDVSNSTEQK